MPRYFFDIRDGGLTVDEEGTAFPDARAARDAALKMLSEVALDEIGDRRSREVSATVRDEAGREVFTASLTLEASGPVDTV